MKLKNKINRLKELNSKLHKEDFLLTWEKSEDDLEMVLEVADILKELRDKKLH